MTWKLKRWRVKLSLMTTQLHIWNKTFRSMLSCFLSSPSQVVRWTSLRSASPSWRLPSLQLRWCTEAPSSTRGPRQGGPWLPAPSPHPPASRLSAWWPSTPPAPRTRRPCTTAHLRPAPVILLQLAAPQLQTVRLLSGQIIHNPSCFTFISYIIT